jgi:hypothetical protein
MRDWLELALILRSLDKLFFGIGKFADSSEWYCMQGVYLLSTLVERNVHITPVDRGLIF